MLYNLIASVKQLRSSLNEKIAQKKLNSEDELDELKVFVEQLSLLTAQTLLKDCQNLEELQAFTDALKQMTKTLRSDAIESPEEIGTVSRAQNWFQDVLEELSRPEEDGIGRPGFGIPPLIDQPPVEDSGGRPGL